MNVPLSLGALVYGESVINDAIAIVLYRTFTGFLTEEVTTSALMLAVLAVFGILIFSVRSRCAGVVPACGIVRYERSTLYLGPLAPCGLPCLARARPVRC